MKLSTLITQQAERSLQTMKNILEIARLGPQFIKKRPFVALFFCAFLATGFLPLLIYLLFAIAVACLGVSLLVGIVGGIITMATVILLVCLIIPACIASGLSLFAYTTYVGLLQMKIRVTSALNDPQNHSSGACLTERCDEKPKFIESVRFRLSFDEQNANPLSQSDDKKASVLLRPQCMEESDCVRA